MIPSLLTFSVLAGAFLVALGLPFLIAPQRLTGPLRAFPRHRLTGVLTMLLGGGWFIWKVLQLGAADFGDYKELMALLFAGTLIASILYVQDFLAVRGVAILLLLIANVGLKGAFGLYDIPGRLVLVTVLYVIIFGGIVYGLMPYLMRDTVDFLTRDPWRLRATGILISLSGVSIWAAALSY